MGRLVEDRTCKEPGCDGTFYGRGMCNKHWQRWRNANPNKGNLKKVGRSVCVVTDCGRFVVSDGLCATHNARKIRTGSAMEDVPVKDFSPGSGDGWITDQGYRAFEICGVRLYEHRVVMAGMVGRELLPTETVHHINGDRSDNRSENLQLRQGNHGKGIVMACGDCGSHNVVPVPLQ